MSLPAIELFEVLRRHDVPFVIVGGHAVAFHGYLRTTEDHDVVFLRSDVSERRLIAALAELRASWISDERDPQTGIERTVPVSPAFVRARHLMMLITDFGFLDVFDYIPGLPDLPVQQLFDTAVMAGGLRYASRDWLRRMKQAAGRPKDLLDIEALDATAP